MKITLELPDGITSVTNEDLGVGPLLVVKFANGRALYIDALTLGDRECAVTVMSANDQPLAQLQFDGTGAPEFGGPYEEN